MVEALKVPKAVYDSELDAILRSETSMESVAGDGGNDNS
jgi:hypothetical protein